MSASAVSEDVQRAWEALTSISSTTHENLGFFERRRLKKAEQLLAAHDDPLAQWGRAKIALIRGEFADALETLSTLIDAGQTGLELLQDAVSAALAAGNADRAEQFARAAVEGYPDDDNARCGYALALIIANAPKRAMGVITNVCKKDPDHIRARRVIEILRKIINGDTQPPSHIQPGEY